MYITAVKRDISARAMALESKRSTVKWNNSMRPTVVYLSFRIPINLYYKTFSVSSYIWSMHDLSLS